MLNKEWIKDRGDELAWANRKGSLEQEMESVSLLCGYSAVQRFSRGPVSSLTLELLGLASDECSQAKEDNIWKEKQIMPFFVIISLPIFCKKKTNSDLFYGSLYSRNK